MASRFASVPTLLRSRKLRTVPMMGDGNCFYRAVCAAYYKDVDMHHLLRRITIEHMMDDADVYEHFFESRAAMLRRMTANKRPGVWNSDLADLVPVAVAKLLGCCIEVYSVVEDEVIRYRFGEDLGSPIRLLHKDNHYDLLLKD
jgi:hypothetical protein